MHLIPLDLKRTLVALNAFQEGRPLHKSLNTLLGAFAAYRPDIGYIQGMGYLGAMLLLYQDTYSAFESMSNLILSSKMLHTFYTFDIEGM